MKAFLRFALALALCACSAARAQQQQAPSQYPTMAPISAYLMAPAEEIRLARTAAPPSISSHAEIMVLGKQGFYVAAKGTNGFVCMVSRSWFAGFADPDFWNPLSHGPECLNPPAVSSVLPQFLVRTQWVLAGATRSQLIAKAKAAYASRRFVEPAPASFAFMLSKEGYLNNARNAWLPHVMPFIPYGQAEKVWAAGLDGSPILASGGEPYEVITIYIPVRRWSDGSPAPTPAPLH
jgi:hypothetical protein